MKDSNKMFTLALASGISLFTLDILTGESLNVLLLGLVPAGQAAAMGWLIRYVTKPVSIVAAE